MTPPERLQDVTLAERLQQEIAAWEDWSTDHDDTPLTTVALLKEAAAALSVRGEFQEYEFAVLCCDEWQAGGSADTLAAVQREAMRYAMQYANDGPVTIEYYERRKLATPPSEG